MHHDKYIVADDQTVQNGSFNYTRDAAVSNSKNVVVLIHPDRDVSKAKRVAASEKLNPAPV